MVKRKAQHPIDDIFLNRWSPRALSESLMHDEELMSLFEAARWAPSSYNGQPWRFMYAKRNSKFWDLFFNLLDPFNKQWAENASYLVVIVSRDTFEYNNKSARTHSFDAGSAWQNLALQASLNNLVAHGMEGFDYDRAKKELHVPDGYTVEAMIAIGKPGNKDDLSPELKKREEPSDRKPVETFAFE